jgi:NADH-quinone oxidoreductase subunit G
MLEIEIDGKKAEVADGSTIMDAAHQVGAYIPHFCYHKKLSIAANCRMCLVQVEKAPKPLPACATPVTNGMKVFTHSELAVKAQKGVMEFLLINHPLDCPVCDQGGECQLQDISVGYGGMTSRYQEAKRVVFHKNVGPLISMEEMSRCIHCTRCVRFGQEIAGVMELGMANRNLHSEITTFVGKTVDSELSGNMIDLCPVGALTSKPFRFAARAWELSRRKSVSPHDGFGTNLTVQVKNNKVLRVLPRENEDINECWIADRDRFSYEALNSSERLTKPMVKQGGEWKEVEWNVAIDYVAHGLKDVAREHGGDSLGFLVSPHATLEELALAGKLAAGLNCGNIDFRMRQRDFSADGKRKGAPWLGSKIADLDKLDSVLVLGSFLRKDQPLLAHRLRQAVKKNFTQLNLIDVAADDPLVKPKTRITVAPSELLITLGKVVKAAALLKNETVLAGLENIDVSVEARAIAQSLTDGENASIFLGSAAQQHTQAAQLHVMAQELARLTGARLGFFAESANSVGAYLAGTLPTKLNARSMLEQPRQAYVLLGVEAESDFNDPSLAIGALKQAKLVVSMSAFKHTPALEYADVMLPIAPFTETSGTYVNTEGRVQSFSGVVRPLAETRPAWKVLRVIGNVLDIPGFTYESSEQVRDELVAGAEFVSGLDNGIEGIGLAISEKPSGLQRIADVAIYGTDPLVRRAPALQASADGKRNSTVRLNSATLATLGIASGNMARVMQGQGSVLITAEEDNTLPDNCVRLAAGTSASALLGEMYGVISVERA